MSILLEHFLLLQKTSGIIRGKVFKRTRLCEAQIRSYFEKTDPTAGIPHIFGIGGLKVISTFLPSLNFRSKN